MMVYEKKIDGVRKSFKRIAKKINASYDESFSGDTLVVYIGCEGGNVNKFLFSKETGYCTFQTSEYNCEKCIEKAVDQILYDMFYQWRIAGENKYVSHPYNKTGLILERENDKVKKIVFKYIDTSDEEYKARYDSLEDIPKREKKK